MVTVDKNLIDATIEDLYDDWFEHESFYYGNMAGILQQFADNVIESIEVDDTSAYQRGWDDAMKQHRETLDKYVLLQREFNALQASFADWKRIHEVERIADRLEQYTDGYRDRADALIQAQEASLTAIADKNKLQERYNTLQKQYDTTVQAAQDNYARLEALWVVLDRLFPYSASQILTELDCQLQENEVPF